MSANVPLGWAVSDSVEMLPIVTPSEFEVIVEQAPILIWRAGTDKACNYFNSRWLKFTGRTLEQELGNGWAEGVHPDDLQRCIAFYVANFDQRQIFEMRYRLKRYDGAWRWLFDRGVPYFDSDGTFAGYIGSCLDVTEQVEAEVALQAARERELEQLHSLLPVCAWCRKIRADDGYWRELEEYLLSKKLGRVTHGVCQSCARDLAEDIGDTRSQTGS